MKTHVSGRQTGSTRTANKRRLGSVWKPALLLLILGAFAMGCPPSDGNGLSVTAEASPQTGDTPLTVTFTAETTRGSEVVEDVSYD